MSTTPYIIPTTAVKLLSDYHAGDGELVLEVGGAGVAPAPTVDTPILVTVVAANSLGNRVPVSADYSCTARTGDTLTVSLSSGTDQYFPAGSLVYPAPSAGGGSVANAVTTDGSYAEPTWLTRVDDGIVAGGFRVVADATAREAIPAAERKAGMIACLDSDGSYWSLNDSPWTYTSSDWTRADGFHGASLWQALSSGTAVANSTTETTVLTGFSTTTGSLTLSANTAAVGDVYELEAWGTYGATSTPSITLKLYLGGTLVGQINALALGASITGKTWRIKARVQVRAIGATGSVVCVGDGDFYSSVSASYAGVATLAGSGGAPTAATVDFTASAAFDLKATWSAADAANTLQVTGGALRAV